MVGKLRASMLTLLVLSMASWGRGQPALSPSGKPVAPGLIKLTGGDEKRADTLNRQIGEAEKADRWNEAIAQSEELVALRRRVQGPKHFDTISEEWRLKTLRKVAALAHDDRVAYASAATLKEQADPLVAQGKYAQAQPLVEKMLEIYRRLLTDDHPDTATCTNNVAHILQGQGKYAQAQPLYEKALEVQRRLLTDDHPVTAFTYDNLSANLDAQGKYTEGQPLCEKALAIRRRLLTDDHPDTADSYRSVADNLHSQRKYVEAQPICEKALELSRRLRGDDHPLTARSYSILAINLNAQGRYAEAQPLYEKALEITHRLLGEIHPDTAVVYNNLAFNLYSQGKYAQAQPLFERAIEIRRRVFAEDHPLIADGYNNLAADLNAQEKYALAQPLYEQALAIRRRVLTDNHPAVAASYHIMATNLGAQGRHGEAQALFEKALAIYRQVLPDDHPNIASTYRRMAENFMAQGKYAQAQPLYEKAISIFRRRLGDDHPLTASNCAGLGINLNAQGKYDLACEQWLLAAKRLDRARQRVAFTGMERAATGEPVRLALAAVLARLRQPAAAWQALEEDLGRGLLDELAARSDRGRTRAERARLGELTDELERLDKLVEAVPKGLDQATRANRVEDLKRARELASIALGEFQTKLAQDHGPLAGQAATLSEIQAALPGDAALVAWIDFAPAGPNAADPDGEHWGVVVRSRGMPVWKRLGGTGKETHWTDDDYGLFNRVRVGLSARPGAGPPELESLVEKLRVHRLQPLAEALGPTPGGLPAVRKLIVLPSSAMAGIPVEVLSAHDETLTISYAPSGTVYRYLRGQLRPDRHFALLALGDPKYERSVKPREAELQRLLAAARSGDEFAPLPGSRREVEALASLFRSDDRPTRTMLGGDASEPELDRLAASGELGRFGFIHLATHGVIDEAIPERSAVILTQTGLPDPLDQVLNRKPVFDGRLLVREIQRSWHLKAELVTLSACETALGRASGGEGFVGFTQALLMSGARSVCLSLWKVDDTATALLMTRFYQNVLGKREGLSKPLPKAEALSEAKQWLRSLTANQIDSEVASLERGEVRPLTKDGDAHAGIAKPASKSGGVRPYDHPYFWDAFVLVGAPD
jgi:CHAT domain-containing protein/tetratricopeptide (TPR) repeat protein